jgi:antitoxin component of MazEF toxin-antitoxin module
LKKVIQVGNSKAVSLPKSWLDLIERETGKSVKEVTMEVNGTLTIQPILSKQT